MVCSVELCLTGPACDERPPHTPRHQAKQFRVNTNTGRRRDSNNLHVDYGVQHDIDDGKHFSHTGEVVPPWTADCELPIYQHRDPLDDVDQEPEITFGISYFFFRRSNLGNQHVVKRMMITKSILMICFLLWLILFALLSWLKDLGPLRLSLRVSDSCSEMGNIIKMCRINN